MVQIYILDGLSWSCVANLDLSSRVPPDVTVWREPLHWIEATLGRGYLSYERPQGTQTMLINRVDASKAYPKSGLAQLEWNVDGSLLLARYGQLFFTVLVTSPYQVSFDFLLDSCPTGLFIYSFPSPSERFQPKLRSVLLHSRPILQVRWNPVRPGALVLCCGTGGMYTWSNEWSSDDQGDVADEEMAECVGVPAKKFQLRDVRWSPDGKGLLLLDKDIFCCAFEVEQDDEEP